MMRKLLENYRLGKCIIIVQCILLTIIYVFGMVNTNTTGGCRECAVDVEDLFLGILIGMGLQLLVLLVLYLVYDKCHKPVFMFLTIIASIIGGIIGYGLSINRETHFSHGEYVPDEIRINNKLDFISNLSEIMIYVFVLYVIVQVISGVYNYRIVKESTKITLKRNEKIVRNFVIVANVIVVVLFMFQYNVIPEYSSDELINREIIPFLRSLVVTLIWTIAMAIKGKWCVVTIIYALLALCSYNIIYTCDFRWNSESVSAFLIAVAVMAVFMLAFALYDILAKKMKKN